MKYNHIISLGSFCSVAMELEKRGLRPASYPFDWLIADELETILQLIENNFKDFLDYPSMYQENNPNVYFNDKINAHFYHDFNAFEPLESQILVQQKKYDRRIKRFYDDIRQPTLFIRYCKTPEDEAYIKNNKSRILSFLKSFNPDNQIIYVMSSKEGNSMNFDESGTAICLIRQPENDFVRNWIDAVPGLRRHLYSVSGLSCVEILKNIYICYRKKILKRLHPSGSSHLHDKYYRHINQYAGKDRR